MENTEISKDLPTPTTPNIVSRKIYKKTYTRKDGSVVSKEYPQFLYNKKHYELNKEKFIGKYMCDTCKINVSLTNRWHHNNTKKHIYYHNLKYTNPEYPIDFIS